MLISRLPIDLRMTVTVLLLLSLIGLTGCGGTGSGPSAGGPAPLRPDQWPTDSGILSTSRQGCEVLDGPSLPGGEFVFALTDSVSPAHAPVPHNRSERIVFAHLYETLINVTCDGTAVPGLAVNWTCTEDSTTWVFTLREDARFWDGTRVTAEDVRRSWARNQGRNLEHDEASPWNWINARAESITAVDARRLAIQLPEPQARFPLLLAHPAAAVALRQPGWTWPVGSGPCRLRASDPAPRPDLICRPNPQHPALPQWKSLVFRVTPGADPRDLAATGFDLALVRERAFVDFFERAPGYHAAPLPWDRLYLLVCPPEMNPTGTDRWLRAAAAIQPARDVVAVTLRDWDHVMFPVGSAERCPQLSGPITCRQSAPVNSKLPESRLDAGTIAFPDGDMGAAELAGRLSHLAGTDARVAALPDYDLNFALQWQMAGAFLVAQDQLFPTGCLQLASLLGRAAWLQQAGLTRPMAVAAENLVEADALANRRAPTRALTEDGVVYPLALGRGWLISRGALAGLRLDFDGTPLLAGLGRSAAPEATP